MLKPWKQLDGAVFLKELQGVTLDEKTIAFDFDSILDFCKYHGHQKETVKKYPLWFLMPGRRVSHKIWTVRKEQIEEWLNLVEKWGKGYKQKPGEQYIKKPERDNKLREDIYLAQDGKYHCKTPWSPLG